MPFLMQDDALGTRAVFKGVPHTAFPWAVTASGQPVYIDCEKDLLALRRPVPTPLRPYTPAISMERRRRCQTALGEIALNQRAVTQAALAKVSLGAIEYVQQCLREGKLIKDEVSTCVAKYMYSKAGFGRLGQPEDCPKDPQALFDTCLRTLASGSLPAVLATHDFMGRVIFAKLKGTEGQQAVFNNVGAKVRPASVFGGKGDTPEKIEQLRGRTARPGTTAPTTAPGLMPATTPGSTQLRERGADKWMPTTEKAPQATIDIQQRNLIFGAGPSGSTGTLLQAAMLFGNLDDQLLRQYVLAVVGYLVGGGMHSYHEVMVIARMAGCPYKDGAYVPSLPDSLLRTPAFTAWRNEFWDIVVLGGKLWMLDTPRPEVGRLSAERLQQFA